MNTRRPVQIPMRVLDEADRVLPDTGVRYQRIAGDSVPISASGKVTCTQAADATLRASLGSITTNVLLRCRPVQSVRILGPMQFMLGDSAQDILIEALGPDGERVDLLAGNANMLDSSIAALDGLRVRPRKPGATLAWLRIGDHSPGVGVHVYERVRTLDGLRSDQTFVAVSLRLESGESRYWRLPAGVWMLTMLPYEDEVTGLRLRIDDANCSPATITPRRIVCLGKNHISVIVYHPSRESAPELTGELLVRRVGDS